MKTLKTADGYEVKHLQGVSEIGVFYKDICIITSHDQYPALELLTEAKKLVKELGIE